MHKRWRLFWVVCLMLVWSAADAITYQARMDEAEWRTESSVFVCKMWQPIPYLGDAVFVANAGEKPHFYLDTDANPLKDGKASLVSQSPVWDPDRGRKDLGYVPVKGRSEYPIELPHQPTTRLLSELFMGMAPTFKRQSWYGNDVSIQVGLSSVNFRKAYLQYQNCLADLLPVGYDDIERTRIHFETARWSLTKTARKKLDLIVRYAKADQAISGFFIDGHTDNVGRRLYNLDLSEKRAKAVTKYLISQGIEEARITTRYHGERYPVVQNNTSKNRATNRRVTIRLERDGL